MTKLAALEGDDFMGLVALGNLPLRNRFLAQPTIPQINMDRQHEVHVAEGDVDSTVPNNVVRLALNERGQQGGSFLSKPQEKHPSLSLINIGNETGITFSGGAA